MAARDTVRISFWGVLVDDEVVGNGAEFCLVAFVAGRRVGEGTKSFTLAGSQHWIDLRNDNRWTIDYDANQKQVTLEFKLYKDSRTLGQRRQRDVLAPRPHAPRSPRRRSPLHRLENPPRRKRPGSGAGG